MSEPFYRRSLRERADVEDPAIEFAKSRGWWHMKVNSLTRRAMPDDLFVRRGVYVWWEFKKPGEEPSPQQYKRHRDMRAEGMDVRWTDNLAAFKEQMK